MSNQIVFLFRENNLKTYRILVDYLVKNQLERQKHQTNAGKMRKIKSMIKRKNFKLNLQSVEILGFVLHVLIGIVFDACVR